MSDVSPAASRLERELSIANQQAHDAIVECARLLEALERIADHDLHMDYADVELRNIARKALGR